MLKVIQNIMFALLMVFLIWFIISWLEVCMHNIDLNQTYELSRINLLGILADLHQ